MATPTKRLLGRWGISLVLLAPAVLAGCERGTGKTSPAESDRATADASKTGTSTADDSADTVSSAETAVRQAEASNPAGVLQAMFAIYRQAKTYEDVGELHVSFEGPDGQVQESQEPIPFSVAFERPNKIRVHALGASVVADGKLLRASAVSLEQQVLVLPCPATLSVANLESDKMLAEAMRGQIDVALPQLPLLLDDAPLNAIAGDGTAKPLNDAEYQGESCHRVAVEGPDGASVFWISPKSGLLVKFEFPSGALKKKFSLAKASIWAEFKGARIDANIVADAFKFDVPQGAKLLKKFLQPPPDPPSPLLAQTPGDFTFQNFKGGTVTQASLQGKIVVLDMWATWCGWCFEGFPNLEKVYQQFKDNDKVVILAVDTDAPTVSDEEVRQSFEKAKLTIPIARDQREFNTKVFKVQGLPTMVILGADGTIEDVHVGYDAQLAETLPKKLQRLLAGESMAKEELAKYEQARKEYEQQLSESLVTDAGGE